MITRLGEGTAIKVMDSSVICDYRMLAFLKELLKEKTSVGKQKCFHAAERTLRNPTLCLRWWLYCGALSIPTRHIHQTVETVHRDDVRATIEASENRNMHIAGYNWDFR